MTADSHGTIRELENRRFRAMCERDVASLEQLLADSLVYTHSSASTDSKASFIDGIRSRKWEYQRVEHRRRCRRRPEEHAQSLHRRVGEVQ